MNTRRLQKERERYTKTTLATEGFCFLSRKHTQPGSVQLDDDDDVEESTTAVLPLHHSHPALAMHEVAILRGPRGTPYEDGQWFVSVEIGPTYPMDAPKVTFITPILHCNIDLEGRTR